MQCTAQGAENFVKLLAAGESVADDNVNSHKRVASHQKDSKKVKRQQTEEMSTARLRVAALMTETLAVEQEDRARAEELGPQIEAALNENFANAPTRYASQTRSIKFNLSKNSQLRARVLSGELTPQEYVVSIALISNIFSDWLF